MFIAVLFVFSNAQAVTVSDTFTRGDNTDIGANWEPYANSCQIVSNQVQPISASSICYETWTANSFTDNQWAQITISNFISSQSTQIIVYLRAAAPPTETYYGISARRNYAESTKIIKYVNGVNSGTVGTENATTWANGDVLYAEISGSTITVKHNGDTILTGDDSEITSGRIGFGLLEGLNFGDTVVDDFSGGDLAAPVGGTARRVIVITP